MLTPYPPSSLVLSTSTTGRSMIASRRGGGLAQGGGGGGRPVAANWVGQERRHRGRNTKRDMHDKERRRCGERGGNSTNSRCKRDGGATRNKALQQPTSTREAQRKERDGGMTREGRGGMARFCTGSTTKALQHDSK